VGLLEAELAPGEVLYIPPCWFHATEARAGLGRAVAVLPPPIRFAPDSRTYSAPLFLNRQSDRTLGARPGPKPRDLVLVRQDLRMASLVPLHSLHTVY
jgi:hypothetical protein